MFTSEADFERADWPFLQNGAINLFWKPEILADAQQALADLNYDIVEVSCGVQVPTFEVQMSRALKWKEQFGYEPWTGNLNAFNDGLRDYPFGPSNRSALVLHGFHNLVAKDDEGAHAILDILESAARDQLLLGKTLVVLVQTDDPAYICPPVGSRTVSWNPREWMDKNRGL